MEAQIDAAVAEALKDAGVPEASLRPFTVARPADPTHGDYYTNAALVKAKWLKRDPLELASELAGRIETLLGNAIANVVIAGSGYINITLSRETVASIITTAGVQGSAWGRGRDSKDFRVVIEYSNPNAFKEMHIGHLVGTVVGEAVSRLIENSGNTVVRVTFGGDIGPNVAKAIWGLQKKGIVDPKTAGEIGDAYTDGSHAYEQDPKAKEEIDTLNQALYAGADHELMELWRKGRDISVAEFKRLWGLLGTYFDREFFDSDTTEVALREVQKGLAGEIFEKSDGAIIYNGEKKGVHTMVFLTSRGTPTYEAKDIGLAYLKEKEWPKSKSIIVTGNEQSGRFQTIKAALNEMNQDIAERTEHISTGFLKLTSGKMSSREGNVVTADEFIREVTQKAGEKNTDPRTAEQVAVGAIKYMILRQTRGSDILFDKEKSLSLEGDSGPYLQYALVRATSVLAQAKGTGGEGIPEEPYHIERLIIHFPEVAKRARDFYMPNLLTTYLTELASEWNAFYAKERIIGDDYEAYKLLVARAFVQTMTNGLALLGIPTPEKM